MRYLLLILALMTAIAILGGLADAAASGPGGPRNLTAEVQDRAVLLTWEPPAENYGCDITGYRVFWNATWVNCTGCSIIPSGKEHYKNVTLLGDVTSYLHTDLVLGMVYYYFVDALWSGGEGGDSLRADAWVLDYPSAPTGLVGDHRDGANGLSWDRPWDGGGFIMEYRVYRGRSPDDLELHATLPWSWSDWNIYSEAPTTILDKDIANGSALCYRISAVNGRGEGPLSEPFWISPTRMPGPVTNLQASASHDRVLLTWDVPWYPGDPPFEAYIVTRQDANGTPTEMGIRAREVTFLLDLGVDPLCAYTYWVGTWSRIGTGESVEVSVTTLRPHPSEPRSLEVRREGVALNVSWRPPEDEGPHGLEGYFIRWTSILADYTGSVPVPSEVNVWASVIIPADNPWFLHQGLAIGWTYYYQVIPFDDEGTGASSKIIAGWMIVPPTAPRNLTWTAGPEGQTITWDRPFDGGAGYIFAYCVYRGTDPSEMSPIATLRWTWHSEFNYSEPQTYFTDAPLEHSVSHLLYGISALNAHLEGPMSDIVNVTWVGPPGPPANLTATQLKEGVLLTWDPPLDDGGGPITGYLLMRGAAWAPPTEEAFLGVERRDHTDRAVSLNMRYTYELRALRSGHLGAPSQVVVVVLPVAPDPPGPDGGPDGEGEGGPFAGWLLRVGDPDVWLIITAVIVAMATAAGVLWWHRRR